MGTPQLFLLVLVGLFGLAALEDKMTAWIQPYPPAPTMYHQLMLSCEVTGDTSVKEFLWEKKGSREPLQKGQSNVLIFSSFNESHLGTYICMATGPRGTAVATYDLWINDLVNQVFVFPWETKDSYVVLQAKPEQPLLNFTVCLRSYTDLTRPHSLFSYATKAQDDEILLFKPKSTEYRFYVGGKSVTFRVPESFSGSEHVCASWESATGIAEFWLNGKPWPRKGLQKDYVVGAEAVILLGQEQDTFGGGFDARQSFVGEISDVYMWDRELTTGEVGAAMYNSPSPAPIFGWRNLPYKIHGKVYLKG